ncbi:MAG: hypothetical protein GY913_03540 [Proteobacteria bacterium]|nr:hypothetical protein [Pseudomonadota bacterium]MCP4915974.1 hypothetical protein [Pseudomonadota bacterium]
MPLLSHVEDLIPVETLLEVLDRPGVDRIDVLHSVSRVAPEGHPAATYALAAELAAGGPAAVALARVNPGALVQHAAHVPHSWGGGVLLNLDPVHARAFIQAKAPWPAERRDELVGRPELWRRLGEDLRDLLERS